MKDYIEREQAITVFKTFYGKSLRVMLEALEEEHAADVRPVRRGKWTRCKNWTRCVCSACSWEITFVTGNSYNFCPNCGADMREES